MRSSRTTKAALAALFALLSVACQGGGGSGSGSGSGSNTTSAASSVALAWGDASGPVNGYQVYVARNSGPFEHEADVPDSSVTLHGEPGETAQIIVVAYDSSGNTGPGSPASPSFTFPDPNADDGGQASASAAPNDEVAQSATRNPSAADDEGEEEGETSELVVADLDGSLLWQSDGALRVTDAALDTLLVFARPDGAEASALADFDGDGTDDVIWVDESAVVSYTPMAMLVDDPSVTPTVELGTLGEGEVIAAAGDFDGDGLGDLLVQRPDSGVEVWLAADSNVHWVGSAGPASAIGVADFDADGRDDVGWQTPDGTLVVWLMDGTSAQSIEIALAEGSAVTAAGDFDGDGSAEFSVRDAAGDVAILHPLVPAAPLEPTDLADTGDWAPAGAADMDRDGTDDLVLYVDDALLAAYLPGEQTLDLDPASPWSLHALLR